MEANFKILFHLFFIEISSLLNKNNAYIKDKKK